MAKNDLTKNCEYCGVGFVPIKTIRRFCSHSCPVRHRHPGGLKERLFRRVNKTETCWLWTGYTSRGGYGMIRVGEKMRTTHRVSWEIHHGPIPIGEGHHGTCVLHRCDNPPCVNPAHLFLGTAADNNRDREQKHRGNQPKGKANGWAKLTEAQVLDIRNGGGTQKEAGQRHGISQAHVSKIRLGQMWGHLTSPS